MDPLVQWAQEMSAKYQVPWQIFYAQIMQESGFNPNAYNSSSEASGIAQIIPSTAAGWGVNPWDPYAALESMAKHMSEYYTEFGNSWENALVAYNCGPGCVGTSAANNSETQSYISKILGASSPPSSASSSSPFSSNITQGAGSPIQQTGLSPNQQMFQQFLGSPLLGPLNALFNLGGSQATSWQDLAEELGSDTLVMFGAVTFIFIGGLWIILGNNNTRKIFVDSAKDALV